MMTSEGFNAMKRVRDLLVEWELAGKGNRTDPYLAS